MKFIISIIILLITSLFSTFVLSNVLLTIFYTIPKLHKERLKNNVIKKIPIQLIIWPPIFYSIVFAIVFYLTYKFLPDYRVEVLIGIGLSLLTMILRIGKKNSDMADDFNRSYKDYLRKDNELSRINDNEKFAKSDYYAAPSDLKTLIRRAFEKYTVNDYRSAIALYDKILDLNPLLASELSMRAQCLELLNYNLDAIDDYELAISIDDSDGNIFGLLGLLYQKIGKLTKAEYFLRLSINKGCKMYEPNLEMFKHLKNDEIKKAFLEVSNKPENLTRRNKKDFLDDLSEIDRKLFNDNLTKQIKLVTSALSLDPNNQVLKELYNNFYSKMN